MSLQQLPADAPLTSMLDVLDADGGLIIEGMFASESIAELRDKLATVGDKFEPCGATQGLGEMGKAFVGANTIRFSSLGKISDAYFDLLDNPVGGELVVTTK